MNQIGPYERPRKLFGPPPAPSLNEENETNAQNASKVQAMLLLESKLLRPCRLKPNIRLAAKDSPFSGSAQRSGNRLCYHQPVRFGAELAIIPMNAAVFHHEENVSQR